MDFCRLSYFKPLAVILCFMLILSPFVLAAEELDESAEKKQEEPMRAFEEGLADGTKDAKGNVLWMLAGAVLREIAIIGACIYTQAPPGEKLVGKSGDYILGYIHGYKKQNRISNIQYACGGYTMYYIAYFSTYRFGADLN